MGISSRNPGLYIGFPSSYISEYFTSTKFKFFLGSVYYHIRAVYETCFRDMGIDWLCLKHVSEIGVLLELRLLYPLCSSPFFSDEVWIFLYKAFLTRVSFPIPHSLLSPLITLQYNVFSYLFLCPSWSGQFGASFESFSQSSCSGKGFDWSLICRQLIWTLLD